MTCAFFSQAKGLSRNAWQGGRKAWPDFVGVVVVGVVGAGTAVGMAVSAVGVVGAGTAVGMAVSAVGAVGAVGAVTLWAKAEVRAPCSPWRLRWLLLVHS